MKILITGGAGYIGSTICSALKDHGHTPIILDSLVTGREEFTHGHIFYQGDIGDPEAVKLVFEEHPDIFATIHCAALIVVPESVTRPFEYYRENVVKSMHFFHQLAELGYPRVVFSSSAAITHQVHDGNGVERFLTCVFIEGNRIAVLQSHRCRSAAPIRDAY